MFVVQHCAGQKLLHKIPTFPFLNLLQHFDGLCDLLVNPVFRAFQVERFGDPIPNFVETSNKV